MAEVENEIRSSNSDVEGNHEVSSGDWWERVDKVLILVMRLMGVAAVAAPPPWSQPLLPGPPIDMEFCHLLPNEPITEHELQRCTEAVLPINAENKLTWRQCV